VLRVQRRRLRALAGGGPGAGTYTDELPGKGDTVGEVRMEAVTVDVDHSEDGLVLILLGCRRGWREEGQGRRDGPPAGRRKGRVLIGSPSARLGTLPLVGD
jgi:hypothetical protein